MISSELDAAGVHDPALREAYGRCRDAQRPHGKTFFLATRLLAPEQRPAVHALYGFARRADDILDDFDPPLETAERAERLQRLSTQLFNQLWSRNQDVRRRPDAARPSCTPRASTASGGTCSTTSWRRCGWT